MVDDLMLDGAPANIAALEMSARIHAQLYANFNPPGMLPIIYGADDITFTTVPNPITGNDLIETVQVVARRDRISSNPVPVLGPRFLDVVTGSKGFLDRYVQGFRPVYLNNIPLSPMALEVTGWATQVETPGFPANTFTADMTDDDKVRFLQVGTASDAGLPAQIANGITAGQLNDPPYNGAFLLDNTGTLAAPMYAAPIASQAAVSAALLAQKDKCAYPLFDKSAVPPKVVGFTAATVVNVSKVPGKGKAKGKDAEIVTLRPVFMADPSVVTDPVARPLNPYLARVRLTVTK